MDAQSDPGPRRNDAARSFALLAAVLVPTLIILGLIFPGSDTTYVMVTGWAAIGSAAGLWLLLRKHGRTGPGYIALAAATFVLVAVLVYVAFPSLMPSR